MIRSSRGASFPVRLLLNACGVSAALLPVSLSFFLAGNRSNTKAQVLGTVRMIEARSMCGRFGGCETARLFHTVIATFQTGAVSSKVFCAFCDREPLRL